MIPRHPALSVELRSEADDLRRYACELEAAGDAAGASAVRDQSMHVEGWVDHVVELEESAASVAVVLDELDLRDVDKLALAVNTMRAESEGIAELLVEIFPPVRHVTGRVITEPAKFATLSTVRDRVDTLCEALELDKYAGIDAAIAEVEKRSKASRALREHVLELEEVVTREVRADALDRIAELERDNATLRAELEARPSSKASADSALKSRKAAWLDEVLDRCPIPRDVTEDVFALLERDDAEWAERFPLLGSLAAALALHLRSSTDAAPVEAKAPDVDKLTLDVDTMRAEYDVELRPVFPASSSVDVAEVPAAGKRVLASFVGPLGEVRRMVEAAAARGVA